MPVISINHHGGSTVRASVRSADIPNPSLGAVDMTILPVVCTEDTLAPAPICQRVAPAGVR
jgi:hypothetical protein